MSKDILEQSLQILRDYVEYSHDGNVNKAAKDIEEADMDYFKIQGRVRWFGRIL